MMRARRAISQEKLRISNAAEVCKRDVGAALGLDAAAVDLRLDLAHLLVGDDKEIPRAAGGIEDADAGDALAQIEQLASIVPRLFQPGSQIVEEERIEHLEDVRHAGVMHAGV